MVLYITRKFSPSIGGMQRFNVKLSTHLSKITPVKMIKWGGSQCMLPFFLVYAFFTSLVICLLFPISCIYVSDGLLSPLGFILKILTRKPVIVNIHGRDIAFKLRMYQLIVPYSLQRLDHVICVSNALKSECLKRMVPSKKISVIPNGVDVEDFPPIDSFQKEKLEKKIPQSIQETPILLTVGRLIPKKGILSFIENIFPIILKDMPEVIYLVIGEGPQKEEILRAIKGQRLEKHVFLLGALPMDDGLLTTAYTISDLFVMPNVPVPDDMEGFGIVGIEASANCLPVVAFNVDGVGQGIKENINGKLIPYPEYGQFASTVCELLKNEKDRMELGEKAKSYIKKEFSWSLIARKYCTIFETLSRQ